MPGELANKSPAEDIFDRTFEKLRRALTTTSDAGMKPVMEWIDKMIAYNVPHGKKNRGRSVLSSYKIISGEKTTEENLEKAAIVGWCIELMQAYFLVHDDIMDHSMTRRGQPCWYLQEGVGEVAINDGCLLHSAVYQLLVDHLRDHPQYIDILELFLNIARYTQYGQSLDLLTSTAGGRPKFELFTRERYATIVKYKTAYYTFALPVRAAMYLAGISEPAIHEQAEKVLLEIGHYFQAQDDYLDCYADPTILGKVGTDIEEGKCCWLAVEACALFTPEQKKIFEENYGIKTELAASKIRKLYKEVNMEALFKAYEEDCYSSITLKISKLCESMKLNREVFHSTLNTIYGRKK